MLSLRVNLVKMVDPNSDRQPADTVHIVSDPVQARLLTEPVSKKFFGPFIVKEKTVTQAAKEVGCTVNTMLYRVKTFLRAGLLCISRQEKRVGRPIKHYRSVKDAFFIPFDLTPYADLEERLAIQLQPQWNTMIKGLAHACHKEGRSGQRLYRDKHGNTATDLAVSTPADHSFDDPRGSTVDYYDVQVQLSDDEARALQRTLRELHAQTYRQKREGQEKEGQGKAYILQVSLVPLEAL